MGTTCQLRNLRPSEQQLSVDEELHPDAFDGIPSGFFSTCKEEYIQLEFNVDNQHLLSNPEKAFQVGLKKGRKEIGIKTVTPQEREELERAKQR